MPFDGLSEGLVSDIVKLRVALDGVRGGWRKFEVGVDSTGHCAIGWLLVAADWDRDEATRLALEYVYPALPESARKRARLESIWEYNDSGGQQRIKQLFAKAVFRAERQAVR